MLKKSFGSFRRITLTGKASGSFQEVMPAKTLIEDRELTVKEKEIASWLLVHETRAAPAFLNQLESARVTGHCSCGCPTVDLQVAEGAERVEVYENPIEEGIGVVGGKMVGLMLLQHSGHLVCLEGYDIEGTDRSFDWPDIEDIRPF